MARIYDRKDRRGRKVFYIDYFARDPRKGTAQRKRERVGYSRQAAEQALQSRVTDIRRGKFDGIFPESTYTLDQFKDEYIRRHSKRKSDGGARDEGIIDQHLSPAFGKTSLNKISPAALEDYRSKRLDEDKGPATINKEVQVLKHMVKQAVRWDRIRTNLLVDIRRLKEPPGRVRYLKEEEILKLMQACPDWLRPIVLIDMNTGLRRGEILRLQRQSIDKQNRLITIEKTKNNERKTIPMNDTVWEVIQSLPNRLDTTYLFAEEDGQPIGLVKVTVAFKRACRKAGIEDFRLHDLRHHFASYLTMAGQNQRTVQELLGHKTPAMTARYSHLSPEHLKAAVASLDKKPTKGVAQEV